MSDAAPKFIVRYRGGFALRFSEQLHYATAVADSEASRFGNQFEAAEAVRVSGLRASTISIERVSESVS